MDVAEDGLGEVDGEMRKMMEGERKREAAAAACAKPSPAAP